MQNKWSAIGAITLALATAFGAYNAHGMEKLVDAGQISAKYLQTFHTGVFYQFAQGLGLLILSFFFPTDPKKINIALWMIFSGMVIFSFSLYLLSFHEMLGNGLKMLGAITPIGGLLMIVGWLYIGIVFWRSKKA